MIAQLIIVQTSALLCLDRVTVRSKTKRFEGYGSVPNPVFKNTFNQTSAVFPTSSIPYIQYVPIPALTHLSIL